MSDPWSTIAPKVLADHEIHLFYEVDGLPLRERGTKLGELAGLDCFPADQSSALKGRYHDEFVWKETTAEVPEDFHEHVRELAAGLRRDLVTVWTLTDAARRLLTRADLYEERVAVGDRVRKQLVLALSKSAADRLLSYGLAQRPFALELDPIRLHVFATGKSFVHIAAALCPLEGPSDLFALEFLEAAVALGRFDDLSWQPAKAAPLPEAGKFGLGRLMCHLAGLSRKDWSPARRVSTYTYAQFAEPVVGADADRLGLHLARHYTTEYAVAPETTGVERVRAFETVRHTVALEGAAAIISPMPESRSLPAFLKQFKTATLRRHYVPIALLALHEHAFLVDRTSRSVTAWEGEQGQRRTLGRLERLRSDSLGFRLFYRFSEVSKITMHNELNRAFRNALGVGSMLADLAANVTEIGAYLRAVEEERAHHRFHWATVIGGAALAGLTAFTIIKEGGPPLTEIVTSYLPEPWHIADHQEIENYAKLAGVLFGLLVAFIACWVGYRRRPSRPDHHDLTTHAMIEHMLHAAKK